MNFRNESVMVKGVANKIKSKSAQKWVAAFAVVTAIAFTQALVKLTDVAIIGSM